MSEHPAAQINENGGDDALVGVDAARSGGDSAAAGAGTGSDRQADSLDARSAAQRCETHTFVTTDKCGCDGPPVSSAAQGDDENKVVHPHKCPRCLSTELIRVSEFTGRFEQPLDRIWNFYGGAIGLRAAVAEGAPKKDTQYGVKTAVLRCAECGYESDNLLHFAEVQSGS